MCKRGERLLFKNRINIKQIEYAFLENKEPAVYPAFKLWFFFEFDNRGVVANVQNSKVRNRMHSCKRTDLSMRLMKVDQCSKVDISESVAVGHEKVRFSIKNIFHRLDAPAGVGVWSCVDQSYTAS